ncbi:Tetratricopeptide repeat (TPR)-containing protein isoform 1 [Hibiscus syriacus]|uniref:Tetratricopeptide repeat (TPR)-containing protein isoform 1 n=1 Tax=Hibiscus syriacus TaxID=106335 RepID=A0A6A3AX90_HIBSY|nr:Tetratricopeptide repeat (TPR)-containing protein isoform 1 [Hibiscus syriacus]
MSRHDDDALSSSSQDEQYSGVNLTPSEDRPSSSSQAPSNATSFSNRLHFGSSSFTRRSDGYGRQRRSPLNSELWISVEFVFTVCQIIASIVVLLLSRNEKPQLHCSHGSSVTHLVVLQHFLFFIGRFLNRNLGIEHDSTHSHQSSSRGNPSETTPYTAISVVQASDEENNHIMDSTTTNTPVTGTLSTRLNGLADHFKMALDCFFAVWFVLAMCGYLEVTHPSDAPKLYRLCIVFLTFAVSDMPCRSYYVQRFVAENPDGEGGVIGVGTAKERVISDEDAVCCVCLTKFAHNDELRELLCTHVFHVDCVDKWLKSMHRVPCKTDVGESSTGSPLARDPH